MNLGHLPIADANAGGVDTGIPLGLHRQPGAGPGGTDQLHDGGVVEQRLAAPVLADRRKQPMFDLVPLTGARGQVADLQDQPRLVSQALQFPLPQPTLVAIAAPAVSTDQQPRGLWVGALTHAVPPAPDSLHRKGGGVMVFAHIDAAGVGAEIVDPIGDGLAIGKVMQVHRLGLAPRSPFLAGVLEAADQFLLLGIGV